MEERFQLAPRFGRRLDEVVYQPRPAVYAVIRDGSGRIALTRGHRGDFLPGGGIEPGEELGEALAREVREECAHGIHIGRPLGEALEYFALEGRYYELRASFFVARLGPPLDVVPEDELVWISSADALARLFYRSHGWAIRLAEQAGSAV